MATCCAKHAYNRLTVDFLWMTRISFVIDGDNFIFFHVVIFLHTAV